MDAQTLRQQTTAAHRVCRMGDTLHDQALREVVDLYGKTRRFDVIAITDHVLMERDLLARAGRLMSRPSLHRVCTWKSQRRNGSYPGIYWTARPIPANRLGHSFSCFRGFVADTSRDLTGLDMTLGPDIQMVRVRRPVPKDLRPEVPDVQTEHRGFPHRAVAPRRRPHPAITQDLLRIRPPRGRPARHAPRRPSHRCSHC